MDREVIFAQKLEQVRALAKEQGNCVSEEQVQEAFAELNLNNDQLQMVFDYLVRHKVGIGQPVNPDDYLTDDERDYLQDYLDELAELPQYSGGEIEAFTISAMAGDADAQMKLTEIYLKDVVEIAKIYTGQGVPVEDLIGEGNVALSFAAGMLGSLEHPGEAQGMLGRMIMNAMEDFIEENAASEKADAKVADRVNKVADAAKAMAEELRRKVTAEELAQESGIKVQVIRDAMRMSGFRIEDLENEQDSV